MDRLGEAMKSPFESDVLIIGAGIIGASIARELSQYEVRTTVAEKSADTFTGQTKTGHGFVYSGRSLNMALSLVLKSIMSPGAHLWEPDSLKIRLGTEGYELFEPLAKRLDLLYKPAKFLMVARNDEELKGLKQLYEITDLMGIQKDVRWLRRADVLDMEPNITNEVRAGLYEDKWTKAIFPPGYAIANAENARANGAVFLYGAEVTKIRALEGGFVTETKKGPVRSRFIVNAAGLYADRVADLAGARDGWGLTHNRTQMTLLDKRLGEDMFQSVNCVQAVPRPGFFEGVQVQVHGNPYVFCGGYNPAPSKEATETRREWFRENIEYGRRLVPTFSEKDVITAFVGIRSFNTRDPEDHIIEFSKKHSQFLNAVIRLPGYSVCAAVAKYVVNLLGNQGLQLTEKTDYEATRKSIPLFSELSDGEKDALIRQDPRYGHIVCRCESVTEGEIVEAIKRGACTVQGIQFRTRAGMGRCQKGFCGPRVVRILARELGIPETEVTLKGPGSEIMRYFSKELLRSEGAAR
ncbi:MAG: FAD-dependent oxidoreductase [Syntrophorhabdales bacterium]